MSQINVSNLTFGYEGSFDNVFEDVSFSIDTNWKLGFIGRNGKGKTTFLRLLLGEYEYKGSITTDAVFDYFPYMVRGKELDMTAAELMEKWKSQAEYWRVLCELPQLSVDPELLSRPFKTLSYGERTKVMLAVLFSGENDFLLIDEPTNHLDMEARQIIKNYLSGKKGFILVSHDRDLLDACVDHMLILNRSTIEVQNGNFTSWWENKEKKDAFARMENEKHQKEIGKLKASADRTSRWAEKSENSKIGFDPVKENDRSIATRAYIGAKTKKMQSRVKNFEKRIDREIEEKEGLLQDIEENADLKIMPLKHYKERLIRCRDLSLRYSDGKEPVTGNLTFEVMQGEIVFLNGANGSGKSSLIKAILREIQDGGDRADSCESPESMENPGSVAAGQGDGLLLTGTLTVAPNLTVSYINQDTSHLKGSLKAHAKSLNLDYSLLLAILRQLDMNRTQFEKNMEDFSEGQKKKVLIATSLLTPAHLYIWDEPLNYIDVFSRMQIERLIEKYKPTMLIVEHDVRFRQKLSSKEIEL